MAKESITVQIDKIPLVLIAELKEMLSRHGKFSFVEGEKPGENTICVGRNDANGIWTFARLTYMFHGDKRVTFNLDDDQLSEDFILELKMRYL